MNSSRQNTPTPLDLPVHPHKCQFLRVASQFLASGFPVQPQHGNVSLSVYLHQPWTDACPCFIALHHYRHAGRSFLRLGSPEAAFSYLQTGGASGQTGGGKEGSRFLYLSLDQTSKCIKVNHSLFFFQKAHTLVIFNSLFFWKKKIYIKHSSQIMSNCWWWKEIVKYKCKHLLFSMYKNH